MQSVKGLDPAEGSVCVAAVTLVTAWCVSVRSVSLFSPEDVKFDKYEKTTDDMRMCEHLTDCGCVWVPQKLTPVWRETEAVT